MGKSKNVTFGKPKTDLLKDKNLDIRISYPFNNDSPELRSKWMDFCFNGDPSPLKNPFNIYVYQKRSFTEEEIEGD